MTTSNTVRIYGIVPTGYYTIIDFNEVDMRIYLPKSDIHRGHKTEVTVDKFLSLQLLKSITVLLYDFSIVIEFYLTEVMLNLRYFLMF